MTLIHFLVDIQHFTGTFETSDSQDATVDRQMIRNHPMFWRTARMWTFLLASGKMFVLRVLFGCP